MNLLYENQSRKIDNLIPKPIRDRLGWEQNGWGFRCFVKGKDRYDIAAEVLGELGLEIPEELKKGT